MTISIDGRRVGEGEPVVIIAEAGINHNGDIKKAKQLIDAASDCGADIIKFQTHLPEYEMLQEDVTASYIGESFFNLLKRCELSEDNHITLKEYSVKKRITFLSTPFSREAVDLLERIGVPAYKTGSGELTNIPLLSYIASKGRPMIVSTGMSELDEISETLDAITKINKQIVLMQCTSTYPTRYEDVNLKAIEVLHNRFGLPIGLSDHSEGIYTALGAVALGACVIEKHFTISSDWDGPDQKASIEPDELSELVKGVRTVHKACGNEKKVINDEEPVRKMARESIVYIEDLTEGATLTDNTVWVKRPGTGIPAKRLGEVLGRRIKHSVKADTMVKWSDLEDAEDK